jgi:type VI secretion system FHA domain protein
MLRLRIVSDHRASLGGNAEKTLHGGSLTVGRGVENGWILPDPDLLLSRQHCVIEAAGSGFRVTDTSTNGVFLNGSEQPIGRNATVPLSSGDRIRIGRFIIEAMVESLSAPSFTEITGAFSLGGRSGEADPFAPVPARHAPPRHAAEQDPFGELFDDPAARPFHDQPLRSEAEPFEAWTSSSSGAAARERADDWHFGTVDDHSDPLNQALSVGVSFPAPVSAPFPAPFPDAPQPSSGSGIPDDWDDEPFGTPQPAAPANPDPQFFPPPKSAQVLPEDWNIDETLPDQAAPDLPPKSAAAVPPPEPDPLPDDTDVAPCPIPAMPVPAPPSAPDAGAAVAAFYEGFGAPLPPDGLPDPTAMMRSLGEALRASLGALHASLRARARFKDEFHLEQTSFRPAGENPLKRCETLDEAVSVLANPRLRGFLPMGEAVREAASDVQVHHLAYAAALQTALKQVVAKFDPGALSQRLETRLLDSLVPAARKARYWDQYEVLYKDLVVELEEDFDRVVGDAIAREYDRFIRRDGGTAGAGGADGGKPD